MEETVSFEDGKINWRSDMVWDGIKRRADDKNWEEVKEFIADFKDFKTESRDYRTADGIRQEYIKNQVDKTNGRVTELEKAKQIYDIKVGEKKLINANRIVFINITIGVIMVVATVVMALKK